MELKELVNQWSENVINAGYEVTYSSRFGWIAIEHINHNIILIEGDKAYDFLKEADIFFALLEDVSIETCMNAVAERFI